MSNAAANSNPGLTTPAFLAMVNALAFMEYGEGNSADIIDELRDVLADDDPAPALVTALKEVYDHPNGLSVAQRAIISDAIKAAVRPG